MTSVLRTQLFARKCVLYVGAPPGTTFVQPIPQTLVIEGLRTTFKVKKSLKKEPNTVEVTVTNLTKDSRSYVEAKGARMLLKAGYENTAAQVFTGDIRFAESYRDGTEWTTRIYAGDGERAIKFAKLAESFKAGTKKRNVFQKLVEKMEVDPSEALKKLGSTMTGEFTHGYSTRGSARREMDRLLSPLGYEWSIQDGALRVLAPNESVKNEVLELTPDSGLIGSPSYGTGEKKEDRAVLKARCLLQPSIRPGSVVNLVSSRLSGVFRVESVEHTGDSAGGDWYSDIEGRPA